MNSAGSGGSGECGERRSIVKQRDAHAHAQHAHAPNRTEEDTAYAAAVREWAKKVPIGLGLCPWAAKSQSSGLLRVVTCLRETPTAAAGTLDREIESLTREGTPPLSTALVVCPLVEAWREFGPFDEFVKSVDAEGVTLVAFHPRFTRWHGLPEGIGVGSVVRCHWGILGWKSAQTAAATIIETNTRAFGARKVKVRYHEALDGISRQEQFVPTDWIDSGETHREPLPDNLMHRSPYPTIHIIANEDLASTCIRDVSRVKRLNARRMAKLGWGGLERRLQGDSGSDDS